MPKPSFTTSVTREKLDAMLEVLLTDKAKIEQEKDRCLQKQIENRKELKTLEKLREKTVGELSGRAAP